MTALRNSSPTTVHPVIRYWITYLLSEEFRDIILPSIQSGYPITVQFYAAKGKVRKRPSVTLGAGSEQMVDPVEEN